MEQAQIEFKSLLDVATQSALDLESTLRTVSLETIEAKDALAATSTTIEDLRSQLDTSEITTRATKEEIARLEDLVQRLEAESARVQSDYQQKIITLDGEMELILVELREKEVATLEELEDLKKNSHLEQERLSTLLATAQSELRLSTGELDQTRQRLQSTEVEAEQLKKEIESVEEQLREEGVAAGAALTELEESATKEMERLTALAELAGEEIEALKGENIGLESGKSFQTRAPQQRLTRTSCRPQHCYPRLGERTGSTNFAVSPTRRTWSTTGFDRNRASVGAVSCF